jgi:formylglycine-generating enzyme required for sulfatase activity
MAFGGIATACLGLVAAWGILSKDHAFLGGGSEFIGGSKDTISSAPTSSNANALPPPQPPDSRKKVASPPLPPSVTRPASQRTEPEGQVKLKSIITNSIGLQMVLIPAGTFLMGSPVGEAHRSGDEGPQHRVRITKPFHLGVHEVTQAQYDRTMGTNPSHFKGPQHPVETVSWDDAGSFCAKLSALSKEKAAGRVYRLPTEAEWEYACRADSTTPYSFGDDRDAMGDHAWFGDNASSTTHPVGEKRPNGWGLYDMHGNVWEWCEDWFGEYTKSPVDDPVGLATGSARGIRGGCWLGAAKDCRTADRLSHQPDSRYFFLGFRVATVPSSQ